MYIHALRQLLNTTAEPCLVVYNALAILCIRALHRLLHITAEPLSWREKKNYEYAPLPLFPYNSLARGLPLSFASQTAVLVQHLLSARKKAWSACVEASPFPLYHHRVSSSTKISGIPSLPPSSCVRAPKSPAIHLYHPHRVSKHREPPTPLRQVSITTFEKQSPRPGVSRELRSTARSEQSRAPRSPPSLPLLLPFP